MQFIIEENDKIITKINIPNINFQIASKFIKDFENVFKKRLNKKNIKIILNPYEIVKEYEIKELTEDNILNTLILFSKILGKRKMLLLLYKAMIA